MYFVSQFLEDTFQKNSKAKDSYQSAGGQLSFDLDAMTGSDWQGKRFDLKRIDVMEQAGASSFIPSAWL